MTQEQKATAYDEAIERAKEQLDGAKVFDYKDEQIAHDIRTTIYEIFPELKETTDNEKIRKEILDYIDKSTGCKRWVAWLEKQGEQKPALPKWKYKKDNAPLLRDSIILNKYGCVAKSPSGAIVSDVWVIDYDELTKLPKEEFEKQDEPNVCEGCNNVKGCLACVDGSEWAHIEEAEPTAWSERDDSNLERAIWYIENPAPMVVKDSMLVFWLKSLKDRYTWKPSDEQMEVLPKYAEHNNYDGSVLTALYQELKKLKGE